MVKGVDCATAKPAEAKVAAALEMHTGGSSGAKVGHNGNGNCQLGAPNGMTYWSVYNACGEVVVAEVGPDRTWDGI